MNYQTLKNQDPEIYELIKKEEKRQKEGLEMIPSESYASSAVLEAIGSIFNDKYAENYPGKRYYGGCVNVDELERLCQKRAKKVFGAEDYHVNVQPYSGSPANLAVYLGLLEFGDTIMAMRLDHGGHLTHGSPVSLSGRAFRFVHYGVDPQTEQLDYDAIAKMAKEHKPKIILSGFTAYPRLIDFQKIHEIAKEVDAISMADTSHISGLIIGGVHPSPFPFTDVVTTTTHKTLRGPRAAMIFCKKELREQIDRAVFPGMQGGPHEHAIAGIAVALEEAMAAEFKNWAKQVVSNAKALADSLIENGLRLISGGTDNHLMLIDLRPFGPGRGIFIEKALEAAGISTNKSPIPNDPSPPYYSSGIRLGTPSLTHRGMKESDMAQIGKWIAIIVKEFAKTELPGDPKKRAASVKDFVGRLEKHSLVQEVKKEVVEFASQFTIPGID
ncbi:MAG: serine hydroxymethyltransferase [Candidatus Doudnabacteria bacterium]|nr:serine hydroxymethyltransferase [Candidatus Doudnabacteria bacterium]